MEKFIVCPACEGEGYQSKIGDFTAADVDEWYGDDYDEREQFTAAYMRRGGPYDEACWFCKAQRVVETEREGEYKAEMEYRAEVAAEQRMGA